MKKIDAYLKFCIILFKHCQKEIDSTVNKMAKAKTKKNRGIYWATVFPVLSRTAYIRGLLLYILPN